MIGDLGCKLKVTPLFLILLMHGENMKKGYKCYLITGVPNLPYEKTHFVFLPSKGT
jgi:hypothetical protein